MTIFLVTSGEYSDYHIAAVFSTQELANEYVVKMKSDGDEGSVEHWETDTEKDAVLNYTSWQCGILLESGEIKEPPHASQKLEVPFRGTVSQSAQPVPAYQGALISRVRSGVSAEHCLKLAAEERQRWLREKA